LFITQAYRNVAKAIGEVPKVTRESLQENRNSLLPSSRGPDQAIGNHAKPEVDDEACVELEWPVAGKGQGRRKEEVRHVAEDDGAESLEQV
jgi:hypothetical protein